MIQTCLQRGLMFFCICSFVIVLYEFLHSPYMLPDCSFKVSAVSTLSQHGVIVQQRIKELQGNTAGFICSLLIKSSSNSQVKNLLQSFLSQRSTLKISHSSYLLSHRLSCILIHKRFSRMRRIIVSSPSRTRIS